MKEQHQLGKLNTNNKLKPNDEWYTPTQVLIRLQNMFNVRFMYDPATTEENAERLKIHLFDTKETNGLDCRKWPTYFNRANAAIWINPPFTLKKDFIAEGVKYYKKGGNDIFILVPDKSITNKYMYELLHDIKWDLIIPRGRINFIDKDGVPTKGNFSGSVILRISQTAENKIYHMERE